jgi:hypothetical protein
MGKRSSSALDNDQAASLTDRGISDAVVVLLLIGVGVVAVALIGGFVFDLVPGDTSVTASLSFEQNEGTVTVFHDGGDELPEDTVARGTGEISIVDDDELEGLTPGEAANVTLESGNEGDQFSVVYEDTVINQFELTEDVV